MSILRYGALFGASYDVLITESASADDEAEHGLPVEATDSASADDSASPTTDWIVTATDSASADDESAAIVHRTASVALTLPQFEVEGHRWDGLDGEAGETGFLELPILTIAGVGITSGVATFAQTLPALTASAAGVTGGIATAAPELTSLELSATDGTRVGTVDFRLPIFTALAVGVDGHAGTASITLPDLTLYALGAKDGEGNANFSLPNLTIEGVGVLGASGTAAFSLPAPTVLAAGLTGQAGTAAFSLPIFTLAGVGLQHVSGTGSLTLPIFIIEGEGIAGFILDIASSDYEIWTLSMNVRNFSVGEYDNYAFNSFCKNGNGHYGANENGIYLLEGNDDAGTDIDFDARKLDVDFGSTREKRATDAYIQLQSEGDFSVKIVADDGLTSLTVTDDNDTALHEHKVNLPRGKKGRRLGIGIANTNGSDMMIDEIELLVEELKRRGR